MSAQRRSAAKRNPTGTATVEASRRTPESRKSSRSPSQPASRPSKPQSTRNKAAESKPHPLTVRLERLQRLYRDTRSEMAKITWPDKETTRNLTIVVIGISFVLGVLLGGIDYVFLKLLEVMS